MDISLNEIFNTLVKKSLKREKIYATLGTVQSVASDGYVIKPNDGTPLISVNRLGNETIEIIPAIGSLVLVVWNDSTNAYTMLTSGVNDVIINTGVNGGMVKVSELTTKLNNLENDINDLKSIFSSWTPVPSDGGAALKLLLTPYYGQTLTPTAQSEIENTKVKH